MSVFINFKICDNASECSGISVCPTSALCWNEKNKTVTINNNKCVSCCLCVRECPAGAIFVAKNEEEENIIQRDIENDPRTLDDLMVERYGASPIDPNIIIDICKVEEKISKKCLTVVEVINFSDTQCLINSIPISEIFGSNNYEYYKVSIDDKDYDMLATKFSISITPTLLIFRDSALLYKIDGFVEDKNIFQKKMIIKKIADTIER